MLCINVFAGRGKEGAGGKQDTVCLNYIERFHYVSIAVLFMYVRGAFCSRVFFLGQMKTSPDVGLILCVYHTFIQDVPDDSYVVV